MGQINEDINVITGFSATTIQSLNRSLIRRIPVVLKIAGIK